MTTTFTFSGGGDDIVTVVTETASGFTPEEYYTYESGPLMWTATITNQDGAIAMRVVALLDTFGCWSFAVAQADDTVSLPDWPIRIRQSEDCRYSTELEITAPDGAALVNIWPEGS